MKEKDFVQDKFFEPGNTKLKVIQVTVSLLLWVGLILPILIVFNSITNGEMWETFYRWTWQDGFELSNYLRNAIFVIFVIVLAFSVFFLLRNNYYEKHVYPKRKVYDEEKLKERKAALEEMYASRFGDQDFRENARYYVVEPEQNIPKELVDEIFAEKGVTIK